MSEDKEKATLIMKYVVLGISGLAFIISVIAKLLNPDRADITQVSYVFIAVTGIIFGANTINLLNKKQ